MAELTIDPTTIRKALDEFVESYKPSDTPTQEVGYVATAGDGIAHVTGLPGCMANELLTFEDGTLGLAFNLDAREIGVVILGDFNPSQTDEYEVFKTSGFSMVNDGTIFTLRGNIPADNIIVKGLNLKSHALIDSYVLNTDHFGFKAVVTVR